MFQTVGGLRHQQLFSKLFWIHMSFVIQLIIQFATPSISKKVVRSQSFFIDFFFVMGRSCFY